MHIIDIRDLESRFIKRLFDRAEHYASKRTFSKTLEGHSLCWISDQPSTRTGESFQRAMTLLGGVSHTLPGPKFSSRKKKESWEDTFRVMSMYHSVLVVRSGDEHFPTRATEHSLVPVINAGNGADQHPTQTLQDLFVIKRHFPSLEGLTVVVVGDLANGRAVRGLCLGLAAHYPSNRIIGVPAPGHEMEADVIAYCRKHGIAYSETSDFAQALTEADVVYMTRLQEEHLEGVAFGQEYPTLTPELAGKLQKNAVVMHPLPRNTEVPTAIDVLPQAVYFKEQVPAGIAMRRAVLVELLKPEHR